MSYIRVEHDRNKANKRDMIFASLLAGLVLTCYEFHLEQNAVHYEPFESCENLAERMAPESDSLDSIEQSLLLGKFSINCL